MSPLISRATDNLGLIFSLQLGGAGGGGPVPVQDFFYDIELFGEGFENSTPVSEERYGPGGSGVTPGRLNLQSNLGGYTKLRMKSLTSSEISFEPQLYLGGRILTSKNTNGSIASVEKSAAGDAAAFSIDGEWMGIAGGGSLSYYVSENFTTGTPTGTIFTDTVTSIVECTGNIVDGGQGGINESNPSAIPQSGPDISDVPSEFFTQSGTGTVDFTNRGLTVNGGAGGAGAGPGVSRDLATLTPSTGGAGNIRIWADTRDLNDIFSGETSGEITSVPGTTMQLDDERNGQEIGPSRVAITATNTGLGITYTDNTTLSLRELKALLDPELEFAFDIELYGEGIGQDNTIVNVTFPFGSRSESVVTNDSGKGGYTKLRMIVPSSASQISFEPKKYAGGISTTIIDGSDSFEFGKGGDAAAFSIDGEWMGVAGGSGQVYYKNDLFLRQDAQTEETITIISTPVDFGGGGVNTSDPTASPEGGQGKINLGSRPGGFISQGVEYRGGSGGGGAGRGSAYDGDLDGPATIVPSGGEGNIRVYEQTDGASDNGDIFLPGIDPIYMRLEDSRDNFWLGASKVVVSHPITGASLEFTSDTTMSIRELRALLIPTQEVVFEIELFGEGFDNDSIDIIPAANYTLPTGVFTKVDIPRTEGGYTKLKMIVPISDTNTISLQPAFYRGGRSLIRFSQFLADRVPTVNEIGSYSESFAPIAGGNAAAFSINGEWMGIAGGGTMSYYVRTNRVGEIFGGSRRLESSVTNLISVAETEVGKGGINVSDPTASPEKGGDQTVGENSFRSGVGVYGENDDTTVEGGGGGGGAPGGTAVNIPGAIPSTAGGGNIRIWSDTNGVDTKGDLTSVSGVYMELLDSQDGYPLPTDFLGRTSNRLSTVTVTNKATGQSITRTNGDQTLTIKEFRNLLYPGVFPTA